LVVGAATGATLFSFTDPNDSYSWGPAYIGDGVLYVSNNDGNLLAFTVAPWGSDARSALAVSILLAAAAVMGGPFWRRRHRKAARTS